MALIIGPMDKSVLGLQGVNLAAWQDALGTWKMFFPLLGISEVGSSISIHGFFITELALW